MREEYHSPLGRTAKNACIEPCSLCAPSCSLLFIPMPSLTTEHKFHAVKRPETLTSSLHAAGG